MVSSNQSLVNFLPTPYSDLSQICLKYILKFKPSNTDKVYYLNNGSSVWAIVKGFLPHPVYTHLILSCVSGIFICVHAQVIDNNMSRTVKQYYVEYESY